MTSPTSEATASTRRRGPRKGAGTLIRAGLDDMFGRRRLTRFLVGADIKRTHADTLFGQLWWVIDPLLQMAVYVLLVTVIFQRSQPAYPLFVFAAILPWKWFTTTVSDAITSVSGQDKLIKQIQFPKIVLPAAATLGGVMLFAFGLIPLAGMLVLMYPDRIHPTLVFIPVVAAVQFVFTLAFGFVLSSLNVFFRDVGNLARHVLRLWFYLSPALYGAETVATVGKHHPTIERVMKLNPFYTILESYRNAIYDGTVPDLRGLAVVLAVSVVFLVVATMFLKRLEPAFAKVL